MSQGDSEPGQCRATWGGGSGESSSGPFGLISTPDSLNEINDSVGKASIQRLQVQPHHVGLGSKLLKWPQQV